MFYSVYILYSPKYKQLYVGCSGNLVERLRRHNLGYVNATKFKRPLILIHQEDYEDKGNAFQRERFLKSLWGAREKKKILTFFLERGIKG